MDARLAWRTCVAPMMDWTDRHCRYFHRQLSRHTRLYTEMIHTNALLHGKTDAFLDFHEAEHPIALQLGGNEPQALAACAKLAQTRGYDEVNLNCGCPSPRVSRGAFGACLMQNATLVKDAISAMRDAVDIEISVKHRIGLDRTQSYDFVRDFVGTVSQSGCRVFIVHARNAWLNGLSPKENRTVPPLHYDMVYQLKQDFPDLIIVGNGGINDMTDMQTHLAHLDGVMIGRAAYHNPWLLTQWDEAFYGTPSFTLSREAVAEHMRTYHRALSDSTPWPHVARHMLGLYHGQAHAREWRRQWPLAS